MDFRHVELLGPVIGPVQLTRRRPHLFHLPTHEHAVDERTEQRHEPEDEHAQADVPATVETDLSLFIEWFECDSSLKGHNKRKDCSVIWFVVLILLLIRQRTILKSVPDC